MTLQELFQGIEGHDDSLLLLQRFIEKKRIPTALLFHGRDGIGKFLVAVRMARAIHCKFFSDESVNGNFCSSCHKSVQGNHPDTIIFDPDQSRIKIEDIRELIQKMNMKPFQSDSKIFVINNAENLQTESANILLKTLEEPPDNTNIILVTSNLNTVLPTIRSRCVAVRFNPLKADIIARVLKRDHAITEAKAEEVSLIAEGSMNQALELSDEETYAELKGISDSIIRLLENSAEDTEAIFKACAVFDKPQEKGKLIFPKLLDILYLYWRDMLVLSSGVTSASLNVAAGRLINIKKHAIFRILELIRDIRNDLQINVNLRIALEYLVLETRKIIAMEQEKG